MSSSKWHMTDDGADIRSLEEAVRDLVDELNKMNPSSAVLGTTWHRLHMLVGRYDAVRSLSVGPDFLAWQCLCAGTQRECRRLAAGEIRKELWSGFGPRRETLK